MALDNPDFSKAGGAGGVTSGGTIAPSGVSPVTPLAGVTALMIGCTGGAGNVLQVEGSNDQVSWAAFPAVSVFTSRAQFVVQPAPAGDYLLMVAGYRFFRIQNLSAITALVWTGNGIYGPWVMGLFGSQQSAFSHPVTMASDQAPLPVALGNGVTSADTILSAPFAVQLAAAANLVLVAAVAGQRVYCLELNLYIVTAAVVLVQLQDGAGLVLGDIRTDAIMAQPRSLRGVAGAVGQSARLLNTNGGLASGTMAGELIYVQKP